MLLYISVADYAAQVGMQADDTTYTFLKKNSNSTMTVQLYWKMCLCDELLMALCNTFLLDLGASFNIYYFVLSSCIYDTRAVCSIN